jgi:predicted nuclease of predicted toxin-antitoxin system
VKFLVDNQLPPALARFIAEDLRVEALHVVDAGLRNGSDADIWAYASENDFILISKDGDFPTLYSRMPSARLLEVRIGNCRRLFLLKVFRSSGTEFCGALRIASASSNFADAKPSGGTLAGAGQRDTPQLTSSARRSGIPAIHIPELRAGSVALRRGRCVPRYGQIQTDNDSPWRPALWPCSHWRAPSRAGCRG